MKFSWVIDANAGEKRGKTITAAPLSSHLGRINGDGLRMDPSGA